MYCSKCGKELTEQSKFCQHCGNPTSIDKENIVNQPDSMSLETPANDKAFDKKKKRLWIFAACGILAVLVLVISFFSGKNGVVGKVEGLLKDDLGTSITITELYYNEKQQACLVEFETKSSMDVAAVYLENGKILYESDFDYYTKKFNNASSSSERGKWSSKVLEYGDLAMWEFAIASNGATDENGWKKLK
ncbi:MAG: zinc-ribbon domain-containing protein [Clostridia bacterium]|nr:zinc-ribbon domain-containing protein [Clostridia bacterium]